MRDLLDHAQRNGFLDQRDRDLVIFIDSIEELMVLTNLHPATSATAFHEDELTFEIGGRAESPTSIAGAAT